MIKRRSKWWKRSMARKLTAGCTTLAILASGGCTNSKENQAAMDVITAQIQTVLAQRSDVTKAKVNYQNSIDASAVADVSVFVKPGSDYESIADEAVRLVWTSKLNPLHTIGVGVTDSEDSTRGAKRDIAALTAQQITDLNGKYGQHPK